MRSFIASLILFFSFMGIFTPMTFSVTQKGVKNPIGQSIDFDNVGGNLFNVSVEKSFVLAQTSGTESQANDFVDCGWKDFGCSLVLVIIDLVTFVPNAIAMLTGILADVFLTMSINPIVYGVPGSSIESGIQSAWKITRDLANIGFIFALFTSAFMLIAGKEGGDGVLNGFSPKKTVVRVVIMALLVNFSMFFCRIIIQTADVFSHVIANQIVVGQANIDKVGTIERVMRDNQVKPISMQLIKNVQPQTLFKQANIKTDQEGSYTSYLIVGFMIFFILLILIAMFVQMGLIFLGRIIGLWLGIILSPIAFVSFAIPFLEKNPYIGFENWMKNFTNLAFLTPLYLFFVYLAATLLKLDIGNSVASQLEGDGFWLINVVGIVLKTLIPLLISLFILMQGKKFATQMAGVIGEMAAKVSGTIGTMATGVAAGATLGGAAFLGRQTLGRAGAAIGNSEGLLKTAEKGGISGWAARNFMQAGDKTSALTFDVRNNAQFMKRFGQATNKIGAGDINIGTGSKSNYLTEGKYGKKSIDNYLGDVSKNAEKRSKENTDYVAGKREAKNKEREDIIRKELAENQEKLEAEKQKIEIETGNQTVQSDKVNSKINENNKKIDDVNTKIDDVNTKIDGLEDLSKLEAEYDAIDKQLTAGNYTEGEGDKLLNKGIELQKKIIETKNYKKQLENEKLILEKEKGTYLNENNKLGEYVNEMENQSINGLKNEIEKLKIQKTNSQEQKDYDKAREDYLKEKTEGEKLAKEFKDAETLNNQEEMNRIKDLITKRNIKINETAAILKKADSKLKENFDNRIKIYEDSIKDTTKKYQEQEMGRLQTFIDIGTGLQTQLLDTQFRGQQVLNTTLENIAGSYELKKDRGMYTQGLSGLLGVITNGNIGGSNIKNNQAANRAANDARGRMKK